MRTRARTNYHDCRVCGQSTYEFYRDVCEDCRQQGKRTRVAARSPITVWQDLVHGRDPASGEAAIYTLNDRETGLPFYVGSTAKPLHLRLQQHGASRHLAPELQVLEYVPEEKRYEAEGAAYDLLKSKGYHLANVLHP